LSRELLDSGIETVADSVQVEVTGGAGRPAISKVRVDFTAGGVDRIRTTLDHIEGDRQGMPEGLQTPAAGTRYAMPLHLAYRQSDPTTALALVDAQSGSPTRTPIASASPWPVAGWASAYWPCCC
jgi:hypothetical protein